MELLNARSEGKQSRNSWKAHPGLRQDTPESRSVQYIRGRSICTLKAVHYKDPPKILIGYETERKDE